MLNLLSYDGPDSAPPLVIVHGLYGSARNWNVIAKRLSDGRAVHAVDLRNHGFSDWAEPHDYPSMAADLAEVIAHLGGQADVVGHSMGGKAAMMLALTAPAHVNRLIVADIAPVAYGHSQSQYIEAMRAVDLATVSRRSEAEAQLAAQGVEPALCSFFTQSLDLAAGRWRLNLDALAQAMPDILGFPAVESRFDGPVLFLSGGASDYVVPAYRGEIRRLFPKARFAKLPGAGHWLHAEKPREFEASVRAFIG